jgi:hypothetical protein
MEKADVRVDCAPIGTRSSPPLPEGKAATKKKPLLMISM